MSIKVYMTSKQNAYEAEGLFDNGTLTVLAGGKIQLDFASHIRGGKKAKTYRENPDYVTLSGEIIKECSFKSPSTAAQFVTGRSCNGYECWKVEPKKSLGQYLKENNLR